MCVTAVVKIEIVDIENNEYDEIMDDPTYAQNIRNELDAIDDIQNAANANYLQLRSVDDVRCKSTLKGNVTALNHFN
jgi:hypothetical protein